MRTSLLQRAVIWQVFITIFITLLILSLLSCICAFVADHGVSWGVHCSVPLTQIRLKI